MRDGKRGPVTTAWPSAASVGASTIATTTASAHVMPWSTDGAHDRSGRDRERESDGQETGGNAVVVSQGVQVDA